SLNPLLRCLARFAAEVRRSVVKAAEAWRVRAMKDPDDRKTHPPRAAASPDSGIAAGDMAPRPGPSARPDRRAQARSPESGRCADEVGHDIALDALAHAVVTEPSGQLDLDLAA